MLVRLPLLLCITACAAHATACLDVKRGARSGNTADAQSTDAAGAQSTDTAVELEVDVSAETGPNDRCSSLVCDDGDPCTDDSCANGICSYAPVPETFDPADPVVSVCDVDDDCDDGDDCTIDNCVVATISCSFRPVGMCVQERNPACGGFDCDLDSVDLCSDGDPCTSDDCDPGVGCVHSAIDDPFCDARCNANGALSLSDVFTDLFSPSVTTVGLVDGPISCNDKCDGCVCEGPAALSDGGLLLGLVGEHAPQCTSVEGVAFSCEPMLHHVRYLVWGEVVATLDEARAASTKALDVDGWCLATDPASLVGRYRGVIDIEHRPVIMFVATIALVDGTPNLVLSELSHAEGTGYRVSDAFLAQQPVLVDGGEGRLRSRLMLPWANGNSETADVTLFSRSDGLAGQLSRLFLGPGTGTPADAPPEASLVLTRLPFPQPSIDFDR